MDRILLLLLQPLFWVTNAVDRLLQHRQSAQHLDETLRLIRSRNGSLDFAWYFEFGDRLYLDRGVVGQMAERSEWPIADWPKVAAAIEEDRQDGFGEIDEEAWQHLEIYYKVEGSFASPVELDKRNRLMDLLDERFALTGQGFWIGSSTGQGTMEIAFVVLDFDSAKASVLDVVNGTEYADFITILDESVLMGADELIRTDGDHAR